MTGSGSDTEPFLSQRYLIALSGLFVASAPLSAWITRAATDRWLASAGFGLAISGLVLGIVGFGITIWQLRRTATATSAVTEAIIRLRKDLGSLDVLTELRSASEAAGEAQNHLREKKWQAALGSYNKIRHCLYKTTAVDGALDSASQEKAKDFIAHALGAISVLEEAQPDSQIDTSTMNSKLRDLEGFLVPLEYQTKDKFGGQ